MASIETGVRDEKIAIVGSGQIGRSWAMLFVNHGYEVSLFDVDPNQTKIASEEIQQQLTDVGMRGLERRLPCPEELLKRLCIAQDIDECVRQAVYVQECVPENQELKGDVLKQIDELVSEETIIGSSTTAILPSILSDNLVHRENFLVVSSIDPPFCAPCVEIVPSPWTCQLTVETTKQLMKDIGQFPIVLNKEIDGFVGARLQFAIQAVAYEMIKDGICDVEDIETAMHEGLGMWYAFMGPFDVEHINSQGFLNFCQRHGDNTYRVQTTFKQPDMMEGETVENIQRDLLMFASLDTINDKRKWRDRRLLKLAELKKRLDNEDDPTIVK